MEGEGTGKEEGKRGEAGHPQIFRCIDAFAVNRDLMLLHCVPLHSARHDNKITVTVCLISCIPIYNYFQILLNCFLTFPHILQVRWLTCGDC